MSLALLLAWALGLLEIHCGQGQPSRVPASGVGQVLFVMGNRLHIRVNHELHWDAVHEG